MKPTGSVDRPQGTQVCHPPCESEVQLPDWCAPAVAGPPCSVSCAGPSRPAGRGRTSTPPIKSCTWDVGDTEPYWRALQQYIGIGRLPTGSLAPSQAQPCTEGTASQLSPASLCFADQARPPAVPPGQCRAGLPHRLRTPASRLLWPAAGSLQPHQLAAGAAPLSPPQAPPAGREPGACSAATSGARWCSASGRDSVRVARYCPQCRSG